MANQVTPERLARLLMVTGPLAIRHITSNLSNQILGFDKLSLSKQRRLIMSCLNQGFESESIIFEKIGWGQWRAKQVAPESFVKERNAVRIANAKVKENDTGVAGPSISAAASARRESITKNKYELDSHNKLLNTRKRRVGLQQHHQQQQQGSMDDYAIASDDDDDDLSDYRSHDDDDENVFKFDDDEIPPLKLNPRLVSPPTGQQSRKSSVSRVQKPKFKPHRSNSQTPTSPELLYYQPSSTTSVINVSGHPGHRKSATLRTRRHSSIRSTLSQSNGQGEEDALEDSETDEEDWATIGALQLLKREKGNIQSLLKPEEQDAAFALVNLRSV